MYEWNKCHFTMSIEFDRSIVLGAPWVFLPMVVEMFFFQHTGEIFVFISWVPMGARVLTSYFELI